MQQTYNHGWVRSGTWTDECRSSNRMPLVKIPLQGCQTSAQRWGVPVQVSQGPCRLVPRNLQSKKSSRHGQAFGPWHPLLSGTPHSPPLSTFSVTTPPLRWERACHTAAKKIATHFDTQSHGQSDVWRLVRIPIQPRKRELTAASISASDDVTKFPTRNASSIFLSPTATPRSPPRQGERRTRALLTPNFIY